MHPLKSKKYSQGYGTVLVALIGAAAVAGTISYEARLQGQTGERNESLKGYLQARELASEHVMMMLAALEKSAVTPIVPAGVDDSFPDVEIVQGSPQSLDELGSQSGVDFSALEQQLGAQVQSSSGWKNASLDVETRLLGTPPRLVRDSSGIPVSLEYTLRVKGKGYYFCPSAGSKNGCATGEAAADFRWKVPVDVAACPVVIEPPVITPPAVTPDPGSSGGSSSGGSGSSASSGSDPCAALAPQNTNSNVTSASSVAIATNSGTLTCTSGNVGAGGNISVSGNATNGQGTSNTQGSATQGSNNIHSTTTGTGSFASNTTTNGNGTQTQSSGNSNNVHNVPAASTAPAPAPVVVGSSSDKYYQASISGNRTLHPWEQP